MAPNKKNKRQPKGPYYFFMMEFKKKQEAAGHQFRGGQHEVQQKASPYWNAMTVEEKEPYNKMAREHREYLRENGEKYTSQGVPISVVEAETKAKLHKNDLIRNTISTTLEKAVANNELEKLEFYFISFAYFCVTSGGTYIPAEMAIVRYSLKDGVMDKLHMLIDPGKLPLGMAYDAKQHSESDHQLPIPPDALGEKDNDEIILKIFSFLSQHEIMPPLYTDAYDIKMVDNILKGILVRGAMEPSTLLVCPLSELFYQLKRATESFGMDIKTFPSVHIAQAIIQKDVYEYTKDISCEYHEEQGNGKYCPLSKCIRWAFIISDSCCLDLSIEMKPGRHLPKNADTALCMATGDGDTSSYVGSSTNYDSRSFVSSSDLTHVTYPVMQKLPRGHYDTPDSRSVKSPVSSSGYGYGSESSVKVKEEYPPLGSSVKSSSRYGGSSSTTSSSRRDPRDPWGSSRASSSSYRDRDSSPPRRSSYDPRYSSERDSSGRDRTRGRDTPEYDWGESSQRSSATSSSRATGRVKGERLSSISDDEDDVLMSGSSRSTDSRRPVGGYGRGSLYSGSASSRSPTRSSYSSDFPELGAVRSAGRGQLRNF